jgi:class 3 adenylate cyclase/tetratricopeptide (TPR) repeat protein
MECPACGHANRPQQHFCAGCGTALDPAARRGAPRRCAACGAALEPDDQYCGNCGHAVAATRAAAAAERRAGAPLSYTPRHIAEQILGARHALVGERKQVTVLFADVQRSMELAEQLDPEEWHRLMDRFFAILTDGVHRFEGTVNQYTGDGIMALFGAPLALEDHAQRACHAALYLREELRRYGDALRVERGLSFSVRMGLNSGEVVVGTIGDDLRMDYTALGHTVGLAARMEQLAEPGKALLTEHTKRLVADYFALRDLGAAQVKGVTEPVHIYALEGAARLQTRFEAARARGLSPLIGRERELTLLEDALAEARAGRGQLITVVGEPGVGKSRLCYEFAQRCRSRGVHVYEAHGLPHGKGIPLLPWLELLRNAFGLGEHEGAEAARDKIAGRMLRLDPELVDAVPLMFEFFGVADPARPAPRMDPDARQRQLAIVVRRLIEARSARGEVAMQLMEDLQWFDAASETFIRGLSDATAHTRTLVVANFRPDYDAAWLHAAGARTVQLQPLGEEAARALVRELLGDDPTLEELAALICERTGGNPFFIEEVVQALRDEGVLACCSEGSARRFTLTRPITDIQLPATVQAVLSARIDRLPEREKAVLLTAAVIGKRFSVRVLQSVIEALDPPHGGAIAIGAMLADLARQELILPNTIPHDDEYAFKHPLTQEVAYRAQLGDPRARTHVAVATVLERVHAHRLDEQAAVLAHHWEAASEPLPAARWHRRAAEWIGSRDRRESTRHWKNMCTLLDAVPSTPETAQLGALARQRRLFNAVYLGQPEDEQRLLFARGRTLATAHGGPLDVMLMSISYGLARVFAGAVADGVDQLREAMRVADRSGNPTMRFIARATLINPLHFSGHLHEALMISDEALALSDGDPRLGIDVVGFSPYLTVLLVRSMILMRTGALADSAQQLQRAREVAHALDDADVLGTSYVFAVILADLNGETTQVLDDARTATAIAERSGSPFFRAGAAATLGVAYALAGEWPDAADALEHALMIVTERRTGLQLEPSWLALLARAYLEIGDPERAVATGERALRLARQRETLLWQIYALRALAAVQRTVSGRAAAAAIADMLDEASALTERTGAASEAPFIDEERAELADLCGDAAGRARALRAAHERFTAIGATGHARRIAAQI